ncbi:hypothetical protein N7513_000852 [Penicillium frequentans]|nr:hypothetical protein N7513_000852 [Penicillium glabrum]
MTGHSPDFPFTPNFDDESATFFHGLFQHPPTAVDRLLEKERHGHLRDQHGRTFLHYVAQYRQTVTENTIHHYWLDASDRNQDKLLRHFHRGIVIADVYGQTALSMAVRRQKCSLSQDFRVMDMLSRPRLFDSINPCWPDDPVSFSLDMDTGHRNDTFTWLIRFGGPRTRDLYLTAIVWGPSPPPETILSQSMLDADFLRQRDSQGRSFLFHAVDWGDEYFIRILLSIDEVSRSNPDFDGQAKSQANSPFLRAIDLGHTGIARLFIVKEPLALQKLLFWLLKEHDDPTARLEKIIQMKLLSSGMRDTALYHAIKLRLPSAVQLFLKDGASPKPFKLRTDWFDLWEKQACAPMSVELEEKRVVKDGNSINVRILRLPGPSNQALLHNARLIR